MAAPGDSAHPLEACSLGHTHHTGAPPAMAPLVSAQLHWHWEGSSPPPALASRVGPHARGGAAAVTCGAWACRGRSLSAPAAGFLTCLLSPQRGCGTRSSGSPASPGRAVMGWLPEEPLAPSGGRRPLLVGQDASISAPLACCMPLPAPPTLAQAHSLAGRPRARDPGVALAPSAAQKSRPRDRRGAARRRGRWLASSLVPGAERGEWTPPWWWSVLWPACSGPWPEEGAAGGDGGGGGGPPGEGSRRGAAGGGGGGGGRERGCSGPRRGLAAEGCEDPGQVVRPRVL